jgi:signal transduction histidine kinase
MARQLQNVHQESEKSLGLLMQVWMRFTLACSSLLVFFLDPIESGLPSELTHALLISYCLYSACFLFDYDMRLFRELASNRATHWIDTIFFSCLIALTGGADSIFFFFLFFPIIVASFSWGFKEGLIVTSVSVALFTIAGLISIPPDKGYDLGEAVLRPIYLIVFGYMISYWGEGRIVLKRRLGLLQDISTNWNPRFGVNHAIMIDLVRLVEFYQGSRCIVVMSRAELLPKYIMHTSDRRKPDNAARPKEIAETTARELLTLPATLAISFENSASNNMGGFNNYIAYDINTLEPTDRYFSECETLSNLLDNESFISVPYKQRGVTSGRIYLTSGNRAFDRSDIEFTKQVVDVLSAVVENMQLIENLVAEAEGQERHRISLDVHDTTIQPYIGLTLALDALSQEFKTNELLTERIGEIINMANMTIQDLRSYKDTLREKSLMRGDVLLSVIKNRGERLQRFYGIQVEVKGTVDPNLSGRLAEAAFQIIKEGLSNILRHTSAKHAFVSIQSNDTHLLLEIGNEASSDSPIFKNFKPKTIFERALSLNGQTVVENNVEGYTVVRINIPLVKD